MTDIKRIFFSGKPAQNITLTGQDARHLGYACRAKIGDEITVAFSDGALARMEITGFTAASVDLSLKEGGLDTVAKPSREFTLAVCHLKGEKMDFLVQKAVELNVTAFQPLISENTVVKLEEKRAEKRLSRWEKIALEAAKQCGRDQLITMKPLLALKDWLRDCEPVLADGKAMGFIAYENETHNAFNRYLKEKKNAKNLIALVGPEGGFTEDEVFAANKAGFTAVSLGKLILRAETAAFFISAAVHYELGMTENTG